MPEALDRNVSTRDAKRNQEKAWKTKKTMINWLDHASEFRFLFPVPGFKGVESLAIQARKWDENHRPTRWCVLNGNCVLDKEILRFVIESFPSERTERHYELTRFDSKEEAYRYLQLFLEAHPNWLSHGRYRNYSTAEEVAAFLATKKAEGKLP